MKNIVVQDEPIPYHENETYFVKTYLIKDWNKNRNPLPLHLSAYKNGSNLGYGFKIKKP